MCLVSLVKIFLSLRKRELSSSISFSSSISLAHFLAAEFLISGYSLSKISKGSTNKPGDFCCQRNVIHFVVKVEQKEKTAASSTWDGENACILAAAK